MKFGPIAVEEAEGCILAHSVRAGDRPIKKGTVLTSDDLARLAGDGVETVIVAELELGDIPEDEAAKRIGRALHSPGLKLGPAFTGRANLISETAGVLTVKIDRIAALNSIDEGMTLATLSHHARVDPDQLVATVKVIPYALSESVVAAGVTALGSDALEVHPFRQGTARLILTRIDGMKESLLAKGEAVVRGRVESLGHTLAETRTVPHVAAAVAEALKEGDADLTLILGASATSDRSDVAPAAVIAAGGEVHRFGMPVDPGNLLFLASLRGKPVVGLPGCARSPALNGVDWVLERLAAGLDVTSEDIAAMGVGGLLKEMPGRPQPRRSGAPQDD